MGAAGAAAAAAAGWAAAAAWGAVVAGASTHCMGKQSGGAMGGPWVHRPERHRLERRGHPPRGRAGGAPLNPLLTRPNSVSVCFNHEYHKHR